MLALQSARIGQPLDGQQYLVGVDGLDEVVGDLAAEGVVHDVFLLALGDHHHGQPRSPLFQLAQRVDARQTGHLLVEEHQVGLLAVHDVEGVAARAHRHHAVAFLFQKHDVGLQQVYLVVGPKYCCHSVALFGFTFPDAVRFLPRRTGVPLHLRGCVSGECVAVPIGVYNGKVTEFFSFAAFFSIGAPGRCPLVGFIPGCRRAVQKNISCTIYLAMWFPARGVGVSRALVGRW